MKPKRKNYTEIDLDQIDIREVLDELNIPYTEVGKNVSEGWIGVQCCFCSEDQSNHLGIHLESPVVSCFKCGTTGNYITYLAQELNSYGAALEILRKHSPKVLRPYIEKESGPVVTEVKLPKKCSKDISPYHATYLEKRKYNPEMLRNRYDLRFCGPTGKWANRIIVPVYRRGRLITFTSIDITDNSDLRYRHLKADKSIIHIKDYLFGLDQVVGDTVIVVEGLFDQFRIGPGCVATFGTKVTSVQKKILTAFKKVIIVFDGDESGYIGAEKLANDINIFTDVEVYELPEGIDPDTLPKHEIKALKQRVKVKY